MSLGFSAPAMSATVTASGLLQDEAGMSMCTGTGTGSRPIVAQLKAPSGLRCRTQSPRSESPLSVVTTPPMSPCCSPPPCEDWMRRGFQLSPRPTRPDLVAACNALTTIQQQQQLPLSEVTEHSLPGAAHGHGKASDGGVPVFVMLPLDSIRHDHSVNRKKAMNASLQALKSAGVEGVMMDVWWGLVEREGPGNYNWSGYRELLDMIKKHGLKVQAVMSFHQCGGNVGDSVFIPLPKWVVEEIDRDNDLAYTDQHGRRNYEYVTLGADTLPVLKGRTPVQCYADFMRSFRNNFDDLMGDTIVEIQVGMGPAGELRYPSYPESNGTWKFPGIGAFQCYDKYMLADLRAAAEQTKKPEWGKGGPTDAGQYNNWPEDTPFFRREGGWNTEYGEFFLSWYSRLLLDHGDRILGSAAAVFEGSGAVLSAKVAGIHWHYGTRSHAPELTAGYYNTRNRNGYEAIAAVLGRHGCVFNFTCIEMRDYEQPQEAQCSPEQLIAQVSAAARRAGVPLAGENALMRFDEHAHEQIVRNASRGMCAFTFLRMCPHLFQPDNWRRFVSFVRQMRQGSCDKHRHHDHDRLTEQFVHATQPLVQEAAAFA